MPAHIPRSAVLRIVRFALLASVLILGVAALLVHRTGAAPATLASIDFGLIRLIFVAIFSMIALLLIVLRSAHGRVSDDQRRTNLVIMAWALGESAAIMGGVYWFLTGRAGLYGAGLAVFLLSLLTIGVREQA